MSLADTLVFRALQIAGVAPPADPLCYGNPATRAAYLAHTYPGDTPANANDMGRKQSACMLVVRGLLAGDEVDGQMIYRGKPVDILRCPYADFIGQIEPMMTTFAHVSDLYVDDQESLADFAPADFVVIGQGGQAPADPAARDRWLADWGGLAHGFLVTGVAPDAAGGLLVSSVDGGQTDVRNGSLPTAIFPRTRRLVQRAGKWWLQDPQSGKARRVAWRMRCADLPLREAA